VEDRHTGPVLRPRRAGLLEPGGQVRPRLRRQPRRAGLLVRCAHRQARLEPLDGQLRLCVTGRRRRAGRRTDGLHRLHDGSFYALDARNGHERWKHNAGGKISGSATVVGRTVYFANLGKRNTRGLDAKTGKVVFKFKRGGFTPVVSDGRRLYLTGWASQYAFVPKAQKPKKKSKKKE